MKKDIVSKVMESNGMKIAVKILETFGLLYGGTGILLMGLDICKIGDLTNVIRTLLLPLFYFVPAAGIILLVLGMIGIWKK